MDPLLRRKLLGEIRRRHTVESAARSPEERLRRAEQIAALGAELRPPLGSRSDEPAELWLRLKAKWRGVAAPS